MGHGGGDAWQNTFPYCGARVRLAPRGGASMVSAADHWSEARIPGTSDQAVTLGRDLDGDNDPDEITIG